MSPSAGGTEGGRIILFEGEVVVVTGAGRGLGRAVARGFAEAGAKVAVNDLNPDALDRTVAEIREAGGIAEPFVADVANRFAVQTMVEGVLERFGRIDALVNRAGVEPRASLLSLDEWDWDRTLAVNLRGAFLTIQSVGRVMAEGQGGAIVNIVPIADRAAGPLNRAAFVASQLGLIGLTHEAARELATYNIRVNAVCPGVIETVSTTSPRQIEVEAAQRMGLDRQGFLEEAVPLVLFLCSPQASSISGQAIAIDGGPGTS